jgi:hypothetical protein
MLPADYRAVKQIDGSSVSSFGLTPMLQGKALEKGKLPMDMVGLGQKVTLKEISEENDDSDERTQKRNAAVLNSLKGF